MTNSASSKTGTKRTYRVLTTVEKLDGYFPGLATEARMMLDQGTSAAKIAKILCDHFPVRVTTAQVAYFRTARWSPRKEVAEKKSTTIDAVFNSARGECDLNLLAVARIRELMDTSSIKDATAVRLCELKVRDQDLKELEFELRVGPQAQGEQEAEQEPDPVAEEAKTKRVMNKIRGIFGLDPLPDDTSDEDPATDPPEKPASEKDPVATVAKSHG